MADHKYHYQHSEANFGPPLQSEVSGGAHLVFDVIPVYRNHFYALRLPGGLHGDRGNALYFPHGLIRFGETTLQCVDRLCREFANAGVKDTSLLWMSSWVDDNAHWHMCLNVLAYLEGIPRQREFVSEVVPFTAETIPDDFPWWTLDQLKRAFTIAHQLTGSND